MTSLKAAIERSNSCISRSRTARLYSNRAATWGVAVGGPSGVGEGVGKGGGVGVGVGDGTGVIVGTGAAVGVAVGTLVAVGAGVEVGVSTGEAAGLLHAISQAVAEMATSADARFMLSIVVNGTSFPIVRDRRSPTRLPQASRQGSPCTHNLTRSFTQGGRSADIEAGLAMHTNLCAFIYPAR